MGLSTLTNHLDFQGLHCRMGKKIAITRAAGNWGSLLARGFIAIGREVVKSWRNEVFSMEKGSFIHIFSFF